MWAMFLMFLSMLYHQHWTGGWRNSANPCAFLNAISPSTQNAMLTAILNVDDYRGNSNSLKDDGHWYGKLS